MPVKRGGFWQDLFFRRNKNSGSVPQGWQSRLLTGALEMADSFIPLQQQLCENPLKSHDWLKETALVGNPLQRPASQHECQRWQRQNIHMISTILSYTCSVTMHYQDLPSYVLTFHLVDLPYSEMFQRCMEFHSVSTNEPWLLCTVWTSWANIQRQPWLPPQLERRSTL